MNIDEMVAILLKEFDIYKQLLEISEKKKDILIKNDVDALNELVQSETGLLGQVTALENKRQTLSDSIADWMGVPRSGFTLTVLIENISSPAKERLAALRDGMLELFGKLNALNHINRQLLETHASYTTAMLSAVTDSKALNNSYSGDGSVNDNESSRLGFIDQQI